MYIYYITFNEYYQYHLASFCAEFLATKFLLQHNHMLDPVKICEAFHLYGFADFILHECSDRKT